MSYPLSFAEVYSCAEKTCYLCKINFNFHGMITTFFNLAFLVCQN